MIGVQTELQVADNTGAKRIECIKVLGGSKRRYASIGDKIVIADKEAITKDKVKNYSKTSKVNCAKHIVDSIYNHFRIK